MIKIGISASVLAMLWLTISTIGWAAECPDIKKARAIIKELAAEIKTDICAKEVNQNNLRWIQQTALPRIMTKSFLGVEPPTNWQQFANELLLGCLTTGNLCEKDVQQQFNQCVMIKLPFILYQLGPWLETNCKTINHAVIKQWPAKKALIRDLMNEYQQKFNY